MCIRDRIWCKHDLVVNATIKQTTLPLLFFFLYFINSWCLVSKCCSGHNPKLGMCMYTITIYIPKLFGLCMVQLVIYTLLYLWGSLAHSSVVLILANENGDKNSIKNRLLWSCMRKISSSYIYFEKMVEVYWLKRAVKIISKVNKTGAKY